MKNIKKFAVFGAFLLILTGCGVKPGQVEPPDDVKAGTFPRTYPEVMTAPPPYVPPAGH